MKKLSKFEKARVVFLGLIFIVPFIMGIIKLFPDNNHISYEESYSASIVDLPNGVSLSNQTFIKGEDYRGTIKINSSILTDKELPNTLDEVKSGSNIVANYTYTLNLDKLSANLVIPANEIKGNILIKITLVDKPSPPPIEYITITLDPNGGSFESGKSTIELTLVDEKRLGDFINYEEPIPVSDEDEFKYWLDGDNIVTTETLLDFTEDVTLKAFYDVKCVHEYRYEIINNQLYSVCYNCGKTIRYSDEELATFAGKMLVMEDGGLVLYDISQLPYIVSRYMAADVYLINGKYDLRGNRDGAQVEIHVHGLNNNEGEMNATILNYAIGDDGRYYYIPLHGIKFTINNVIMESAFNYSDGFYFGLYSDSLICNNCRFIGKHSFYADYVEINDSTLDSSMITSDNKTDYAVYVYGSSDVVINRCTFDSVGKAIKIYNEGITASRVIINDCIFNAHKPLLSEKAAVEIDSTYQTTTPYHVEIHHCTNNGHYQMWFDKSEHSVVIED